MPIGTVLQELLGWVAGEAVGAAADKPLARLATELRQRLSLPLVVAGWVVGLAAMVFGWRLGVAGATGVLGIVAILLWIAGPITALMLTGLWWRRDA
jgi:lipopolysaccharide export LptBFGC system permease protein LptF